MVHPSISRMSFKGAIIEDMLLLLTNIAKSPITPAQQIIYTKIIHWMQLEFPAENHFRTKTYRGNKIENIMQLLEVEIKVNSFGIDISRTEPDMQSFFELQNQTMERFCQLLVDVFWKTTRIRTQLLLSYVP